MDQQLVMSFQAHSNSVLDAFFTAIVYLSSKTALLLYIITAFVIIFFFLPKDKKYIYHLTILLFFSSIINLVLKNIFRRLRPYVAHSEILGRFTKSGTGYSFPSGHAQLVSTIAFFIIFNTKSKWIKAVSFLAVIVVCLSRVYFGLHYFSDILAGFILGFVLNWLASILWNKKSYKKS